MFNLELESRLERGIIALRGYGAEINMSNFRKLLGLTKEESGGLINQLIDLNLLAVRYRIHHAKSKHTQNFYKLIEA